MRKRRKALFLILTGIFIVCAVIFTFTQPRRSDHEPVYKDLTLAQWLDVVDRRRIHGYFPTYQGRHQSRDVTLEEINEATEAVRAIGTNALPSLLAWISYEPSNPRKFYRGILDLLPMPEQARGFLWGLPSTKHEGLAELAVSGFRILNTNALAIAELTKLANDTNHPRTQIHIAKVLLTITNAPPANAVSM